MDADPTILFIPLEPQVDGTVHRGSNMLAMLRQRYAVRGLPRRRNFGTGTSAVRSLRMAWYWLQILVYGWRVRRAIDLIFCENTHAVIGGMLAKATGKPCIWDIEAEDAQYLNVWGKSPLFSGLVLGLHHVAGKLTDTLLVPTEEDRQAYIKRGYLDGHRVITVPLAVDFSRVPIGGDNEREALRRSLELDPHKTVLIYTGQRTEPPYREGAEWICQELAPRLAALREDVHIILTGGGDVIPCPAPNIVSFMGFVSNVYDYIRAADVCLAPIWREVGVPGKVFEYMALGKPAVVTTQVRGLRHLTDGWDAMVASTPEDFVAKVTYLIRNSQQARTIGARARETARRCHSYEAVTPDLWRVVGDLMVQRSGRSHTRGVVHDKRG